MLPRVEGKLSFQVSSNEVPVFYKLNSMRKTKHLAKLWIIGKCWHDFVQGCDSYFKDVFIIKDSYYQG